MGGKESRCSILAVEEYPRKYTINLMLSLSAVSSLDVFYCLEEKKGVLPFLSSTPYIVYFKRGVRRVEMRIDPECIDKLAKVIARDIKITNPSNSIFETIIRAHQRELFISNNSELRHNFTNPELSALASSLTEEGDDEVSKIIDMKLSNQIDYQKLISKLFNYLSKLSPDSFDIAEASSFTRSEIEYLPNTFVEQPDQIDRTPVKLYVSQLPTIHTSSNSHAKMQNDSASMVPQVPILSLPGQYGQNNLIGNQKINGSIASKERRHNPSENVSISSEEEHSPKGDPLLKDTCLIEGFSTPWAWGFLKCYNVRSLNEGLTEVFEKYLRVTNLQRKRSLANEFETICTEIVQEKLQSHGLDLKTIDWMDQAVQEQIYANFEAKCDLDQLIFEIQHKVKSYSSPGPDKKKLRENREFLPPPLFIRHPRTGSFERTDNDDPGKSEIIYNKLAQQIFNDVGNKLTPRIHSPISPNHDPFFSPERKMRKRQTVYMYHMKRGSVDLYDKKRENMRSYLHGRNRVIMHDKHASISDDSGSSIVSSLSPVSKTKSRRTIDFPSKSLFQPELIQFYKHYSNLIQEQVQGLVDKLIEEMRSNLGFHFSDKEISNLHNIRKQSKDFYILILYFKNKYNLRELFKNQPKFLDCTLAEHSSNEGSASNKEQLKSNKSLFDLFASAQLQFMSDDKDARLMNKQVLNLEALLSGSNMMVLGAFEVWLNTFNDDELADNLNIVHRSLFARRVNDNIIKVIKAKQGSQKSSQEGVNDKGNDKAVIIPMRRGTNTPTEKLSTNSPLAKLTIHDSPEAQASPLEQPVQLLSQPLDSGALQVVNASTQEVYSPDGKAGEFLNPLSSPDGKMTMTLDGSPTRVLPQLDIGMAFESPQSAGKKPRTLLQVRLFKPEIAAL